MYEFFNPALYVSVPSKIAAGFALFILSGALAGIFVGPIKDFRAGASWTRVLFVNGMTALTHVFIALLVLTLNFSLVDPSSSLNEWLEHIIAFIARGPYAAVGVCTALGLAAYWVRCQKRVLYGIIELLIGAITGANSFDLGNPTHALQFAGAVYIIVRGLDNIAKGIKRPEIKSRWESIFGSE